MIAFFVIFGRVFSDLKSRLSTWLPGWIAVGGIVVSGLAAYLPKLAVLLALFFLFLPIIYFPIYAFVVSIAYWKHEGLLLLFDVTRREFYKSGQVHESWTREIRNVAGRKTEDILDVPMFWDIPLEQVYPIAIHVSKKNAQGRYETQSQIYEVSSKSPEYSERLFEGRKFYGCVIPAPLGLDSGETMVLKLIYRHTVSTPEDDQIIRALPRLLRLTWEGNANDGLKFDPKNSYIEARYPDPFSAAKLKETKRASRYLRFEEADTRMVFDLPMPKSGFHYRVVFRIEEIEDIGSCVNRSTQHQHAQGREK